MNIKPIKTRVVMPPHDDLLAVIQEAIPRIKEHSILAITSKVISIWQGRCVSKSEFPDKDELIKKEADKYLPRDFISPNWGMHTIKNNLLVPSAGIDESNTSDYYILWPRKFKKTAKDLWSWIRETYHIKNVGIIITDSHTTPLRRGTIGICLAYYGFMPLKDYRGKKDLFGRKFKFQTADLADGLAAAAVLIMGEGIECTPLALITDVSSLTFTTRPFMPKKPFSSFEIEEKMDLYYPFLSSVPWKKGGGGFEQ